MTSSSSATRVFVPLFGSDPEVGPAPAALPTLIDLTVLPQDTADDASVVRGDSLPILPPSRGPELRTGSWTRLGATSVLGDSVTEGVLSALAETTRAAAQAQGYARGWAEGRQEAALAARAQERELASHAAAHEDRRTAEHAAAVAALTRAAHDLARAGEVVEQLVQDQALDLARELTEELVGHELRTSQDPAGDVIRRALRARPTDAPVVLRLHPDHVHRIDLTVDVDALGVTPPLDDAGVRLVADPRLDLADAVLEVEDSVIDLRLAAALSRVREALS